MPRLFKRGYNEAEVDAFVDLVTIELNRRPPGRGSF
jgi:DivIVA domain-containing protein